jgi:hypothetical protein
LGFALRVGLVKRRAFAEKGLQHSKKPAAQKVAGEYLCFQGGDF